MKQEFDFMALVCKCLGLNTRLIEDLEIEFDVTVSEEAMEDALEHFKTWRRPEDMQTMIVRHIFQTVVNRYKDRLDEKKFVFHIHEPYLEYDGQRIWRYQNLDAIIREQKEVEQWEAQKNAPREFLLTDEDKKILLDWGNTEEDLDQIELEANVCVFTQLYKSKPERPITRDEAIKLLGRREFLSGIDRTAFHWTAERQNGNKRVSFDSGIVGRHINRVVY